MMGGTGITLVERDMSYKWKKDLLLRLFFCFGYFWYFWCYFLLFWVFLVFLCFYVFGNIFFCFMCYVCLLVLEGVLHFCVDRVGLLVVRAEVVLALEVEEEAHAIVVHALVCRHAIAKVVLPLVGCPILDDGFLGLGGALRGGLCGGL